MKFPALVLLFFSSLNAGTIIQFGGDETMTGNSRWQSQIGGDQIIDWVGNSSSGGASRGSVGGPSGLAPSSQTTLTSDTYGLTLTSVAVTGGTGTYSSGNPNILGVGPTNAVAKFDVGESWTFGFDGDVQLRQLVFSALNYDDETIVVSVPGVLGAISFNRTNSNMAAVTYPGTQSDRFVYTFPTALDVPAGVGITLGSTRGQWGLQGIVVEIEAKEPPPPPDFNPNPDGGVELAPLTSLNPVPNVIIFLADDMGIGDTSAYQDLTANPDIEQIDTPQLERLANLGTRFTDAHTNGATCSPSRISLLSGTYSFRSELKTRAVRDTDHIHGVLFPGRRTTIAHMLQRAGFRTYGYGKWHMALRGDSGEDTNNDGVIDVVGSGQIYEGPLEVGFDTFTGTPGNFSYAGAMIQDKHYMRFGSPAPDDYSLVPINDPSAVPWSGRGPEQATDPNLYKVQPAVFGKLKLDLAAHLEAHANAPFFLYYASHSNHDPYVPANYDPDHPDGPRASLNGQIIDTAVTKAGGMIPINTVPDFTGDGIPDPDYENNPGWIWNDPVRLKWWDHVTEVDAQGTITVNGPTNRAMMVQENDIIVGYMLDFLEQTDDPRNPGQKLIDNTIFIFTSDNGADIKSEAAVGALPQSSDGVITDLNGFKGTRWEGGSRVPFIAAWPKPADSTQVNGIPPAATSSAIFGLNDIYATIAEAIGHRLHREEAVDSESLLEAWTSGVGGTVRATDLLSKYDQYIFSRRGEMKLAAQDGDYNPDFRNDRFADRNNLDFVDMVLDYNENGWNEFVRALVNLATDLDEVRQADRLQANPVAPEDQALAEDMLQTLNSYTRQGYSRSGAVAFENGLNFKGGDLLADANWHAYKNSRTGSAPEGAVPGIIAEDGAHSGDVVNRMLVHRAGFLNLNTDSTGELRGSLFELDGGTLSVGNDLRLNHSRFEVYRGTAELGVHDLELNGSDCVVIVSGGTINAARLSVGEAPGTTEGFKIIRFKGGAGSLILSDTDPIGFGDDGSTGNDFIDFVTGARGRLVSTKDAAYFSALWDMGHLRIDGVAGSSGGFPLSDFKLIALGDGFSALILDAGQQLAFDYDDDGICDIWEHEKVGALNILDQTSDYDGDGILDADEYILDFNPTEAESGFILEIVPNLESSGFEIRFNASANRIYAIRQTDELSPRTEWTTLELISGADGLQSVHHDPGTAQQFYNIKVFVP